MNNIDNIAKISISDERLKTNIKELENSLEGVMKIKGYEYEFNETVRPEILIGIKKYGLIAQEVEKEFPLAVRNILEIDGIEYKGIEYRELIPILVQSIQELNNKIINLENKIKNLEG